MVISSARTLSLSKPSRGHQDGLEGAVYEGWFWWGWGCCPEPDPTQMCTAKGYEEMGVSYGKGNSHGIKGGNSSRSGCMMEQSPREVVGSLPLQIFGTRLYKATSNQITLKVALKSPPT